MSSPVDIRTLRHLGVFLLIAVLCAPAVAAKQRKAAPRLSWGLSAALTTNYNDNLIGLSERDRNSFVDSPARIPTPLESVDDLEHEAQLRPVVKWRAPRRLMVTADYRLRYVKRWRNDFTDYWTHTVGLGIRPRVAEAKWNLRLRVAAIPSFYLRVYKDKDYNAYHTTRYSNWDYETTFRYHLSAPFWIEAGAGLGSFYYNRKFTEYDSEFRDFTGGAGYEYGKWSLDGSYTRRLSENIGKDQLGAALIDPDQVDDTEYGDSDYSEDEFNAGLRRTLSFVRWRPTDFSVQYKFRRRVYLTDRPLESDPFHRGRLDKRGQLTASLTCRVDRRLDLRGYMTYDAREVDAPAPQVALAKDFVRREYGLQVEYTIR